MYDWAPPDGGATAEELEKGVISLLVGYCADRRLAPAVPEKVHLQGAGSDFEKARKYTGKDEHRLNNMLNKAFEFVEQNWPAITAVAEELLKHETLSDPYEIEFIIAEADGDGDARTNLIQLRMRLGWYLASRKCEPFHKVTCHRQATHHTIENLEMFRTRKEATKAGYRPCKVCKP